MKTIAGEIISFRRLALGQPAEPLLAEAGDPYAGTVVWVQASQEMS